MTDERFLHMERHNYHHPRSCREAFGEDLQPLRDDLHFGDVEVDDDGLVGRCATVIAIILFILILTGVIKL